MNRVLTTAIVAIASLAASTVLIVPAVGHGASSTNRRCAAEFDRAQRMDMESFRDFDAATFRRVHDRDAVSIFPSGARFEGIDAIMAAQEGHFTAREAVWSWTEINRRVDGCSSAFIEYDATYAIPRIGFEQRALTVVSYVRKHGRWVGVMDQGTLLPPDTERRR